MKKISKTLLAIILSFVMLFGVIACGPTNNGGSTGGNSENPAPSESSSTIPGGSESTTPGDDDGPVTITVYTAVNIIEQNSL